MNVFVIAACTIGGVWCSLASDARTLGTIMNATGASACFSMALNSACVTFTPTGSCLPFKDTVPSLVAVCDGAVDSVISFAMRNLNVSGTLPSQIGLLTALTSFAVAFCDVHGTVPSQLGELTNLQALRLFENALSGTLPAEMAKMTSLRDLYIDQNAFSGDLSVLPDELALTKNSCVVQNGRSDENSCFNCSSLRIPCSCTARLCKATTTTTKTMASSFTSTSTALGTTFGTTTQPTTTNVTTLTVTNSTTTVFPLEPSETNIGAIVGGAIGGALALALLGGAIAFLVCRARRKQPNDSKSYSVQPPSSSTSIYSTIPQSNEYDVGKISSFVQE
jgi:hypothetical protein